MFKHSKNGITITDVLDTRHQRKNGEYPIKIRVTYKSDSWYYPTGQYICKDDQYEILSSNDSVFSEQREIIEESYLLVKSHVNSLVEKGIFSFARLKSNLRGINQISLNAMFNQRIKELKKRKQIGTMESLQSTLNIIEKHFPKDVAIENIDLKWIKEFEKYLQQTRRPATVYLHIRNIRTIMNLAIKQGYISKNRYPFGKDGYQFRLVYGRKKALTPEQIKKIVDFKSKSKDLMKFRDLWLFMYLCNGITIDDLITLKYGNIYDGEICFVRGKTRRMTSEVKDIKATITPEMLRIINRWGNKFQPDNYIFPTIRHTVDAQKSMSRKHSFTKVFNSNLKIIGTLLDIDNFTSTTARHSYATVLKQSGVSIAYISESLGHKNMTTTEHYLAQFEKNIRKNNSAHLLKFE